MPPPPPEFILLLLVIVFAAAPTALSQNSSCPLDFTVLDKFTAAAKSSPSSIPSDTASRCTYTIQVLHLVFATYLRSSSLFLPPLNSSAACWVDLRSALSSLFPPPFDPRTSCGFETAWISQGCMNITTLASFESLLSSSLKLDVESTCNQSLSQPCTACTTSINRIAASLPGPEIGNVTRCSAYPSIYAAGFVNRFGPSDNGTAYCIFVLNASPSSSPPVSGNGNSHGAWIYGVSVGGGVILLAAAVGFWFLARRFMADRDRRRRKLEKRESIITNFSSALETMASSTTLVKFSFEDIRAITKNFSRHNIIGKGGYGNVYKGVLDDGTEVALKRFKNCSAAGDADFTHEVEVIASVRHVNLVALRGYCTATTEREGHQRIIVCDLMVNGSVHDHLFGSQGRKLSWPIRQRIALGTARGLAYLHYDAQPTIIHRDIKASNILLDEKFEAKVADFGLARFAPEGMSHVSTRVAGTLGYVAPEYALYGQLTAKSDVYSFGVVLLELLSGRKAFVSDGEGVTFLITDWAWALVRKGRALDVIEEGMEELGPKEVLEKYVLVAVLSSHPQLHARPTMDQIVKILETDVAVPSIPDRPLSLVANMDDIEKSVSSSGSGQLSSFTGYQPFTIGNDGGSSDHSEIVSSLLDGPEGGHVKSYNLL